MRARADKPWSEQRASIPGTTDFGSGSAGAEIVTRGVRMRVRPSSCFPMPVQRSRPPAVANKPGPGRRLAGDAQNQVAATGAVGAAVAVAGGDIGLAVRAHHHITEPSEAIDTAREVAFVRGHAAVLD